MSNVCYFLVGNVSQDIHEGGAQGCLLWRLKDPENPFCKVIEEPSQLVGGDSYKFDGEKARKKCICFEKDSVKGATLLREFEILYG